MPYLSTLRILTTNLLQPTSISAFASLGIHVLVLGMAFPKVEHSNPIQSHPRRFSVRTIQLSDIEQARLPVSLQTLASASPSPDTALIDPALLKNAFFSASSLSPLPPPPEFIPGDFTAIPLLPNLSALPSPLPMESTLPEVKGETIQPPFKIDSLNESGSPFLPGLEREAIDPNQVLPQPSTEVSNQTASEINSKETTDDRWRQQGLELAMRQRAENLKLDRANTTDDEANNNHLDWLGKVRETQPQKLKIQGKYPQDACLRKLEGNAVYGVSVNASGKAVDFHLIKSSGYSIFNQQARKDIDAYDFASGDTSKSYSVDVEFEYSPTQCPSLSISKKKTVKETIPVLETPKPSDRPAKTNDYKPEVFKDIPQDNIKLP